MNLRRTMSLALIVVVQYLYYLYVINNSTIFNDGWPLQNISSGFIIWSILTIFCGLMVTKKFTSMIIFSMILLSSGIILTPILKYSNELYLYNSWDSLAHYNFANYILNHGFIPSGGLVYSETYRLHPANGVVPAILAMILPVWQLGLPMAIYMIISNIVYLISIILNIARKIRGDGFTRFRIIAYLSAFSFLYFYSFYCGSAISYGLIGLMIYMILLSAEKSIYRREDLLTLLLLFIGLWATHLSSASLMIIFILLSLAFKRLLNKKDQNLRPLYTLLIVFNVTFLFLQIIVDLIVTKNILVVINNTLKSLSSREVFIYRESQIPLLSAVMIAIFVHLKHFIISFALMILISFILFYSIINQILNKRLSRNNYWSGLESARTLPWVLASTILWVIGYIATQELVQGFRATTFSQWFLIVLLIEHINKFYERIDVHAYDLYMKRIFSIIFLVMVMLINVISNYGTPQFAPIIRYEDGVLGVSTASPVNDITLNVYIYLNKLSTSDLRIIGIEPYTTFALLDILLTQNKFLIIRTIFKSKEVINLINDVIEKNDDIVIPMPLTYKLGHAKYLYESFYELPNNYLRRSSAVVYSNGGLMIYYYTRNNMK
ncbi:MAG: hypothetical protein QXY55_05955 [Candidatus Korarchaeota archaeon]